uniref:Uncharacterized protein n=1 Tax=Kalanchoe fedtschenkoi TaxID=63787 RepID=A0A7N0VFW1_KALFE
MMIHRATSSGFILLRMTGNSVPKTKATSLIKMTRARTKTTRAASVMDRQTERKKKDEVKRNVRMKRKNQKIFLSRLWFVPNMLNMVLCQVVAHLMNLFSDEALSLTGYVWIVSVELMDVKR